MAEEAEKEREQDLERGNCLLRHWLPRSPVRMLRPSTQGPVSRARTPVLLKIPLGAQLLIIVYIGGGRRLWLPTQAWVNQLLCILSFLTDKPSKLPPSLGRLRNTDSQAQTGLLPSMRLCLDDSVPCHVDSER